MVSMTFQYAEPCKDHWCQKSFWCHYLFNFYQILNPEVPFTYWCRSHKSGFWRVRKCWPKTNDISPSSLYTMSLRGQALTLPFLSYKGLLNCNLSAICTLYTFFPGILTKRLCKLASLFLSFCDELKEVIDWSCFFMRYMWESFVSNS